MQSQTMTDKELINDSVSSQKYISGSYNVYANECVTPELRNDFLGILNEEHQIQAELFTEMQNRGWYQVQTAEQNKISQAKQKFSQM
jgi:spore coat protein CotF